ncbi:MAG: DNA-directed RNA polymerase subunit omega [Clostridia bacterium]|nr:DNA-directed RNA polymerase subunit omega [Clostridia bacterium]MBO5506110.1 DNA-directed RNA polymerase subunit omega [Clostridia bacterium]
MMIYPPITELVEKTGSRYTLVIETAKRARQLAQGAEPLVSVDSNKEVTQAVNEIYNDKLILIGNADDNSNQ